MGTQPAKRGKEWIIVLVGVHIPRHLYLFLFVSSNPYPSKFGKSLHLAHISIVYRIIVEFSSCVTSYTEPYSVVSGMSPSGRVGSVLCLAYSFLKTPLLFDFMWYPCRVVERYTQRQLNCHQCQHVKKW